MELVSPRALNSQQHNVTTRYFCSRKF